MFEGTVFLHPSIMPVSLVLDPVCDSKFGFYKSRSEFYNSNFGLYGSSLESWVTTVKECLSMVMSYIYIGRCVVCDLALNGIISYWMRMQILHFCLYFDNTGCGSA